MSITSVSASTATRGTRRQRGPVVPARHRARAAGRWPARRAGQQVVGDDVLVRPRGAAGAARSRCRCGPCRRRNGSASRRRLWRSRYELDEVHRRVVEQQAVEARQSLGRRCAGPQGAEQRQVDDACAGIGRAGGCRPTRWPNAGRSPAAAARRCPPARGPCADGIALRSSGPEDRATVRGLHPTDISEVGHEFCTITPLSARGTSLTG